jgi:hypothetical protein
VCRFGESVRLSVACSEPFGKHFSQDGRIGRGSCVIDIAFAYHALARRTLHRRVSSSTPKLIDQSTHHAPSSGLTLLSSTIGLHACSSARLALHPPSQTVVSLFLLRSSYKPCRQPPSRRPRQDLPSMRKPDDPAHASRDRRSRQLRERKLHRQEV